MQFKLPNVWSDKVEQPFQTETNGHYQYSWS